MVMGAMNIFQDAAELYDKEKAGLLSDIKYQNGINAIEGIYIFISFDLVNSTLFKSRHMELWPEFISTFYLSVVTEFGINTYRDTPEDENNLGNEYLKTIQKTGGFYLWKLVGDEVLLYHKVVSKDELYQTILYIDRKRQFLIKSTIDKYLWNRYPLSRIKEEEISDETRKREKQIQDMKRNECEHLLWQYFSVKTTVWLGSCASDSKNVSVKKPNVIYDTMSLNNESISGNTQLDFCGSRY